MHLAELGKRFGTKLREAYIAQFHRFPDAERRHDWDAAALAARAQFSQYAANERDETAYPGFADAVFDAFFAD